MGEFNIADGRGRDAKVVSRHVMSRMQVRWLDDEGRPVALRRVIRGTVDRGHEALLARHGSAEALGAALLHDDPEVDIEVFGTFLSSGSRVYIDPTNQVVHQAQTWEVVVAPDGSEQPRRPRKSREANVNGDIPVKFAGKLMKKSEVYNKFVFAGMIQLVHVNGLTYDFLYEIARDLAEKDSMMRLGAGPKGTDPVVLRRGATQYRAFLEGRIDGPRYALLLHLTNQELKAPAPKETGA